MDDDWTPDPDSRINPAYEAAVAREERQRRRRFAVRRLNHWRRITGLRDSYVRYAIDAGLSQREVAEITGIARTTIARIIAERG